MAETNITAGGVNTEIDYYANGYLEKQDVTTSAAITNAAACGYVQSFTTTGVTLTLPAAAVGLKFKFRVGKPGLTVKIKPASTETFTGLGVSPTASYILTLTNAPAGSYLEFDGQSGNWNITAANLGGQGNSGVVAYAAT